MNTLREYELNKEYRQRISCQADHERLVRSLRKEQPQQRGKIVRLVGQVLIATGIVK